MSTPLLSDELWTEFVPLLPPERPKPQRGRPRIPDPAVRTGVLLELCTGCLWEALPVELGCGSGGICWRSAGGGRGWQTAGVWDRLHRALLNRQGNRARINWSRASVDSASVPAKRGRGDRTEPDRPGQGRRHAHLVVDRRVPIAVLITPTNVHDSQVVEDVLDVIPPVRGRRPAKVHANKGYDLPRCRIARRTCGITPRIARRGIESSVRLAAGPPSLESRLYRPAESGHDAEPD